MRWFKVAAITVGVLIAFLVVSSVIGFLVEVAIAALVVATIVLAIKVAFYRKQVSWKKPGRQVRGPRYSSPLRRHNTPDIDDELTRLKREMGSWLSWYPAFPLAPLAAERVLEIVGSKL